MDLRDYILEIDESSMAESTKRGAVDYEMWYSIRVLTEENSYVAPRTVLIQKRDVRVSYHIENSELEITFKRPSLLTLSSTAQVNKELSESELIEIHDALARINENHLDDERTISQLVSRDQVILNQ